MSAIDNKAGIHIGDTCQPVVHSWINSQYIIEIETSLNGFPFVDKLSIKALVSRKNLQFFIYQCFFVAFLIFGASDFNYQLRIMKIVPLDMWL